MWNDMFRSNIFLIPFDLFFKSTTMCTLRHHKKTKNRYISPKNMVFVSRIGRRSDATVVQLSAVQHCEQKKSKKGRFFTHIQHYCTLAKKRAHISAQIILSILLGPASRWLISWMKRLWGNNWGWDKHTFYGECAVMLDRAIKIE